MCRVKPKNDELAKSPKAYFHDTGFRNISIENFSKERADMGSMYENYVFSELIKQNITPKYWRTKAGAEVDFIVEKGKNIIPIEIKTTLSEEKITKSFHSFIEKYKPKKGLICSIEFEGKKIVGTCNINFIPLVKLIIHINKHLFHSVH